MVHFITTQKDSMSVEAAMRSVNNYVELRNADDISNRGKHDLLKKEYDSLLEDIEYISRNCVLTADVPIHSGGTFRRIKIFMKKAVRAGIRWYIRDITKQQSELNEYFVRCIDQQTVMMKQMMTELEELRAFCTEGTESRIPDDQDRPC